MGKRSRAGSLIFVLSLMLSAMPSEPQMTPQPAAQKPVQDQPVLGPEDKVELGGVFRLRAEKGDQIWPGFGAADIPVILFNARYKFLIGQAKPSAPWEAVPGDDFEGRPYFRRPAHNPQAFAVKVGALWAGSIGTLGFMNSKIPFKLSPDFHVALTLHEVFHAFQAERAPERFAKALAVYKLESRYPIKDKEFAAAWTEEGAALGQALKAADEAEAGRLVRTFLQTRESRRREAGITADLLDYEQELEWLEGLAKYAEIRAYELAVSHPATLPGIKFGTGLPPIMQWDFVRLEKQLGSQDGDLRFYLSGMAQARLLDRLDAGWKSGATLAGVNLEDALGKATAPAR